MRVQRTFGRACSQHKDKGKMEINFLIFSKRFTEFIRIITT